MMKERKNQKKKYIKIYKREKVSLGEEQKPYLYNIMQLCTKPNQST